MKAGKSLQELAIEVERQNNVKEDIIVRADNMRLSSESKSSKIFAPSPRQCTDVAVSQLATRVGIPSSYFKKLYSDAPALLDDNVNHWLANSDKNMMVRSLDGKTRAFLSDRYKRVDNYEIMETTMNGLRGVDHQIELASCEVTDNRMYLKFESPTLEGDIKVGDPVRMGLTITNSEIGTGAFEIKALIYRLVCSNGLIMPKNYGDAIRRTHLGGRQALGVVFAEETVRIEGQAMALKVRDTVRQLLSENTFRSHLAAIRETTERKVTGSPIEAIKVLGKTVGFNEHEGDGIMRHLIQGGDLSQWGITNAVTAYAQEKSLSYDRASALEEIGGKIITLNPKQWKAVAQAA